MTGWVKLHRKIINWEWYLDHNVCRLFIHCILRANHSDTNWRGKEILRGQFLTSLETLTIETGLTVSKVRTALNKLELTGEIASLSQARSRIITVVNYDSYHSDDRLIDNEIAGKSQDNRSEIATDKNVKNVKNKTIDHSHDHLFEKFWQSGIRKVNKKKAKSVFIKLLKSPIIFNQDDPFSSPEKFTDLLIDDVKKRLDANQLGFTEMHPTTYLNGERWNDQHSTSQPPNDNHQPGKAQDGSLIKRLTDRSWAVGIVPGLYESEDKPPN